MSALSISSLISFFGEEQKSITKGENHYKSGHVESFNYSQGILRGEVHASMRNKVYKVTVSGNGSRILTAVDSNAADQDSQPAPKAEPTLEDSAEEVMPIAPESEGMEVEERANGHEAEAKTASVAKNSADVQGAGL